MNCLDCGGSECVCKIQEKLDKANKTIAVYEAFFDYLSSSVKPTGFFEEAVTGIMVDGNEVPLTPRAKKAWLNVCKILVYS